MALNKIMYLARTSSGKSLSDFSFSSGISKLRLNLYEKGYLKVREKDRKAIIIAYSLPETFFDDIAHDYPEGIDESKKSRFLTWLISAYRSLTSILISLFLLIFAIGETSSGCIKVHSYSYDKLSYYDNSFRILYSKIESEGILSGMDIFLVGMNYSLLDIDDEMNSYAYTSCLTQAGIGWSTFAMHGSEAKYSFDVTYSAPGETISCETLYYSNSYKEGKEYVYSVSCKRRSETSFDGYLLKGRDASTEKAMEIEVDSIEGQSLIKHFESSSVLIDKGMGASIERVTGEKTNLYSFLSSFSKANLATSDLLESGFALLTVFPLFALIFLLYFIGALSLALLNEKKKKAIALGQNIENENAKPKETVDISAIPSRDSSLPANRGLRPFIPETFIRGVGVLILLFGSLYAFLSYAKTLGVWGVRSSPELESLIEIMKYFVPVGTILLFFTKLDIITGRKTMLYQSIGFFVGGVAFYIVEIVLFNYFMAQGILLTRLMAYTVLPGSFFFGIAAYSILAFFLFYKPKGIKTKGPGIVIFRLGTMLPLIYIVLSVIYGRQTLSEMVFGSLTGTLDISVYLYFLLYPKSLVISSFAVGYLLGLFVLKKISEKKYGDSSALFQNGNAYMFAKNILAASLVLLLGILCLTLRSNSMASSLGFNDYNLYIACLAPLLLFYRPHLGKRNAVVDGVYLFGFSIAGGISIILIVLSIVPYITFG